MNLGISVSYLNSLLNFPFSSDIEATTACASLFHREIDMLNDGDDANLNSSQYGGYKKLFSILVRKIRTSQKGVNVEQRVYEKIALI